MLMHNLSAIRQTSYAPEHVVAIGVAGPISWSEFMSDIASNRKALTAYAVDTWALFETDSYRFAVALFALLAEGKTIYLPGECHEAVVGSLKARDARFIGTFDVPDNLTVVTGAHDAQMSSLVLSGSVIVFTSGSTGEAKAITKTLAQFDAELEVLEELWGERLKDSLVAGTVSHQHLYGLLFLVLWPLCCGRRFWHRPFLDPVIMANSLIELPQAAWIMSPAHLHRLSAEMPWRIARERTTAVFSSGGPLAYESAQVVFAHLGQFPYEVLGSSETGGVAWRQQVDAAAPWTPLPGVSVKASEAGALTVKSNWLHDAHWYETADTATMLEAGCFRLGARLDRIVKVEGKRVSLVEAETLLDAHAWIEQCRVLVLQRRRQVVGAAIVLTELGAQQFTRMGQHRFTRELRRYLGNKLPAAGVPRVWRRVSELPVNAQGKIQQRVLEGMFAPGHLPTVVQRREIPHGCCLLLEIAPDSAYFEGHFPDTPILPGVVQLIWAQQFAEDFLKLKGRFVGMQKIKFMDLVFPQDALSLSLEYHPESGQLQFQYESAAGLHSQGTLLYDDLI